MTRRELFALPAAAALGLAKPAPASTVAIARSRAYDAKVYDTLRTMFDQVGGLAPIVRNKTVAIALGNNASSQSRGSDARSNRVATEMSARVVEVGPNGLVRLEGTKKLNVEKSKISLAISGWARTQDVTFNNLIPSSRLADGRLEYQAEGPLGTPKGGTIGRLLGKLWP